MRSSWTCCLLLLYHELLMPATFPPFGSLHTDFLLSILLLYITSYFTSIQKSAKIVGVFSTGSRVARAVLAEELVRSFMARRMPVATSVKASSRLLQVVIGLTLV